MKKIASLFFVICMSVIILFDSCKKDNDPGNHQKEDFRIISEYYIDHDENIRQRDYSYENDKLTKLKLKDFGNLVVNEYSYENDKVITKSKITYDMQQPDSTEIESLFTDGQLQLINASKYIDDTLTKYEHIEFNNQEENMTSFIEYHFNTPYAKGVYQYENGKLSVFTLNYPSEESWERWTEEEFYYEGEKLKESYFGTCISNYTDFIQFFKYIYQYSGDLLIHVDIYSNVNDEWTLTYYKELSYDGNNNLVKETMNYVSDSTEMSRWEYAYEKGKSNVDYFIYRNFTFKDIAIYPRP